MADHSHRLSVDPILVRILLQELAGVAYIRKTAGPATAGVADPAVLEVRRCEPLRRERGTKMPHVGKVIFRPPETAVDCERKAACLLLGKAQIHKLIRIAAVGHAGVGFGSSQG